MTEPLAHAPADDPRWQESMAFVFGDEARGVGGTAAFGTFATAGVGLTWLGLWARTAGGTLVFQRSHNDLPLTAGDRTPDRLGAGRVHYERRVPGAGVLDAGDDGVEVRLELRDFYPPSSWTGGHESLAELAAGHVETSCAVTGAVRFGGNAFTVDGLGHRDHSWGPRATEIIRNHRWIAGTCGPQLGFSLEALHLADGTLMTMGFVARDGEIVTARHVENLVTLDHDGVTPRSFESRVSLADGASLRVESEQIHACLYNHRGSLAAVDALARVRVGDLVGVADLNIITNPQAGTAPPSRFLGGTLTDGLTTLAPDGSPGAAAPR